MTPPAAFSATYADWKLIRGRKVVQVVFEIPLEKADEAYQVVGGMPDAGAEKWFGIAALTPAATEARQSPISDAPTAGEPHKKSWEEIMPSQQAGILCSEPHFWMFLNGIGAINIETTDDCATWVRQYLKVNSRADITPRSPVAMSRWRELVVDYRLWERAVV